MIEESYKDVIKDAVNELTSLTLAYEEKLSTLSDKGSILTFCELVTNILVNGLFQLIYNVTEKHDDSKEHAVQFYIECINVLNKEITKTEVLDDLRRLITNKELH